jgi:hypothetical protein
MKFSNIAKITVAIALASTFTLLGVKQLLANSFNVNFTVYGLSSSNSLIRVSFNPNKRHKIIPVTGLDGNLQGIDFRPAKGLLYGLTDTDKVYTIDPETGASKLISTLNSSFDGGFQSGLDFNPVPDRLRLVGSNDQNRRFNADDGTLQDFDSATAGVQPDLDSNYPVGDPNAGVDPNITAVAYTNSIAGATTTQLFGIDYDLDTLVLQDPPNNGALKTIGKLGINFAPTGGFDIFTDKVSGANLALALSGPTLYTIDLTKGTAAKIADMPSGSYVGLAVIPR